MKLFLIISTVSILALSCAKRESLSDMPAGPNTSLEKDGSAAGTGSRSSLGSENPGSHP